MTDAEKGVMEQKIDICLDLTFAWILMSFYNTGKLGTKIVKKTQELSEKEYSLLCLVWCFIHDVDCGFHITSYCKQTEKEIMTAVLDARFLITTSVQELSQSTTLKSVSECSEE